MMIRRIKYFIVNLIILMALNCKFLIASTNIVVVARREVTIEFVAVLI